MNLLESKAGADGKALVLWARARANAAGCGTLIDEWRTRSTSTENRVGALVSRRGLLVAASALLVTSFGAGVLLQPADHAQAAAEPQTTMAAPHGIAWVDVIRPFQMFDLTGGDFARLPLRFAARRDEAGTARQQTLTYGTPRPGERFFQLTLTRRGDEATPPSTFFVETARSGAEAGLAVLSSGLSSTIATRFGAIELADVTLAGAGARAGCLGFRRLDGAVPGPLAISGIACLPQSSRTERGVLACTIDKLDLISAGDDEDLQRFFAEAERARQRSCDPLRAAADPDRSVLAATFKRSLPADNN